VADDASCWCSNQGAPSQTSPYSVDSLTFKSKTNPTESYLGTCDLPPPWNLETPEIKGMYRPHRYSGRFRKPRKRFKTDPTLKRMAKKFSPRGVG
ncbi:hypothetical protein ACTXT7_010863, partial [Hymenolepis weldensis]